jgi:hypothetical protein
MSYKGLLNGDTVMVPSQKAKGMFWENGLDGDNMILCNHKLIIIRPDIVILPAKSVITEKNASFSEVFIEEDGSSIHMNEKAYFFI